MPVMSFKVDADTERKIRAKARAEKTSVSAYLRKVAVGEEGSSPVKVRPRKHPVSGLPYNAAASRMVVAEDEIKAALADFP
jgi:hypothetical protein